jgi:hypothetical protein
MSAQHTQASGQAEISSHTPGPWHVSLARGRSALAVDDSKGLEVALLTRPHGTTSADARLIAAAPELLAALREIAALDGAYCGVAVELARAALTKAEVRS